MPIKGKQMTIKGSAFITNVSYPRDTDSFVDMIEKNEGCSDLESLFLESDGEMFSEDEGELIWTAPNWAMPNDMFIFYHSVSALPSTKSIYNRVSREYPEESDLIKIAKNQISWAEKYAGTIFAIAKVGYRTKIDNEASKDLHFDSKTFARPLDLIILDNPIHLTEFRRYVEIRKQATITPVAKSQFDGLWGLICRDNKVGIFENFNFVDNEFEKISKENWKEIIVKKNIRFLNENQVRKYYLDLILEEIKDDGSKLYEECVVSKSAIADYFISINNKWYPVEAKLHFSNEDHLFDQLNKYAGTKKFTPHNCKNAIETRNNTTKIIIGDAEGIHFVDAKTREYHETLKRTDVSIKTIRAFQLKIKNMA